MSKFGNILSRSFVCLCCVVYSKSRKNIQAFWNIEMTFLAFFIVILHVKIDSTESSLAPAFRCADDQFKCSNQKCIFDRWHCDGEDDCGDGSDEVGCGPKSCSSSHFQCSNGKCIPKEWMCDQEDDCKDGKSSDEKNCGNRSCGSNEFQCNNTKCILLNWRCDKKDDCGDNSDEEPTMCAKLLPSTCASDQFSCGNGQCISQKWVCDSDDDCSDSSDESPSLCSSTTCASDEYRCKGKDQKCIKSAWKCDGDNDCSLGDDEKGCPSISLSPVCSSYMFTCKNNECILSKWRCDGEKDCSDGSDEINCPKSNCTSFEFACAGGGCIPLRERCNGQTNCADGSDELACSINECLDHNGHCQQICNDLQIGYNCSCRPGYVISPNNTRQCDDVDECLTYGQCSQRCVNFKGGHKCTCQPGYVMEPDHTTCRAQDPDPYLVFSSQTSLRKMTIDGYSYNSIVTGRKGAVGIDFDLKSNKIFWTDPKTRKIHRANLDGTGNLQDIVGDVRLPDAIAVDWVGRKIYWTDGEMNLIELAELDGRNRMTLYSSGLDEPRAIAVHPEKGYVYWSDWGNYSRIERGAMDGSSSVRRILVDTDLGWVNGMALDYTLDRLYWVDARLKRIETIKLDGTDRRLISSILNEHPFAVTVFENYLYYSDWSGKEKAIRKMNKFTGGEKSVVKILLWSHMDIKVVHPYRQPNVTSVRANACSDNNGGCSHLCLLAVAPKTFTCRCPNGMKMTSNGKTCIGKQFTGQPTPATTVKPQPSTLPGQTTNPITKRQTTIPTTNQQTTHPTTKQQTTHPTTKRQTTHSTAKRSMTKLCNSNTPATKPTEGITGGIDESDGAAVVPEKYSSTKTGPHDLMPVITLIVAVIILLIIIILTGAACWFWRTKCGNYKPRISYSSADNELLGRL